MDFQTAAAVCRRASAAALPGAPGAAIDHITLHPPTDNQRRLRLGSDSWKCPSDCSAI